MRFNYLLVYFFGFSLFVSSFVNLNVAVAADVNAAGLSIEQRLSRLERLSSSEKLVEIFLQIKRMQQEMDALRGELEILSHSMEGVKRRQKDLYVDLDQRIQVMELAAKASALPVQSVSAPSDVSSLSPVETATTISAGDRPSASLTAPETSLSIAEQQVQYEQAFNLLKEGQYEQSIAKFQAFLQVAPTGDYSDNAQYWLGEALYVLQDYQGAITEFTHVVENFPNSPKVPDAHLKIGFSYQELQADDKANEVLQRVVDRYPDTTAARLASRRMQQMRAQQ